MPKKVMSIIRINKPYPSTRRDKKLMVFVRNPKTGRLNVIHFGQNNSRINHSKIARQKYLRRSAGIRDKRGRLTKDNPRLANYWTRKILWGFGRRR